jgi:3-oxoacyl-[acyl-carrier protein] reductase
LNVNVRAQIIASKAALAHLGKGGRIITIGSYFADRVSEEAPPVGLWGRSVQRRNSSPSSR